MFTQKQHLRFS